MIITYNSERFIGQGIMIGEIIKAFRRHYGWTQQVFVEALSSFDEAFGHTNTVTLSRWETGTTAPGIHKKRKLLLFLLEQGAWQCDRCREMLLGCYDKLTGPLTQLFNKNYNYIIGNLPERNGIDEYRFLPLHELTDKHTHIELIRHIEEASNAEGYYTYSAKRLYEYAVHPSSFSIVCEWKKQHLGHFVMFKLKNDVAKAVAFGELSEMALQPDDFCNMYDKGTYYIHALYGRSPYIAARLNVSAYRFMLFNLRFIDNVLIFSTRADGATITRDYGIETVASGRNEHFGFTWHGMFSPVEKILFSDTVLKFSC